MLTDPELTPTLVKATSFGQLKKLLKLDVFKHNQE